MTNFADRTIWTGDNLDILRGLNSAPIDLIYLDPPFNSNRNYAAPVGSAATSLYLQKCLIVFEPLNRYNKVMSNSTCMDFG